MIDTVSLAEPTDDLYALFLGYFSWASTLAKSEYGIEFDPTVAATESMANLAQLFPPQFQKHWLFMSLDLLAK